jgi:hypothetical protein
MKRKEKQQKFSEAEANQRQRPRETLLKKSGWISVKNNLYDIFNRPWSHLLFPSTVGVLKIIAPIPVTREEKKETELEHF